MSPDEIREASPAVGRLADLQVRSGGVHLLMRSIVWALIVLGPFRRREEWAWWAMWTFPAWALSVAIMFLFVDLMPGQPTPPPATSGWVILGLTSMLLFAVRHAFFPSDLGSATRREPDKLTRCVAGALTVVGFAVIHDLWITDIWFNIVPMVVSGAVCGPSIVWGYREEVAAHTTMRWFVYNGILATLLVALGGRPGCSLCLWNLSVSQSFSPVGTQPV